MLAAIADAARRLAALRFDVRIVPVWDRDERACREVARAAGLPDHAVCPLLLDAEAFIDALAAFDLIVTVKLHAAVLAAAAGLPFVAIEYRPKVRDFAESVGWSARTFRSNELEGSRLARAVLDLYDCLPVATDCLNSRVGELAETCRAYAARVEALLLA